jgi:hypothetical protein
MDLIFVVTAFIALVALDVAALRWGRDSRHGRAVGRPERHDWW